MMSRALCRELKKDILVYNARVSDHALAHGQLIALNYLSAQNLKASCPEIKKRKKAEWLQFITGPDLTVPRPTYLQRVLELCRLAGWP